MIRRALLLLMLIVSACTCAPVPPLSPCMAPMSRQVSDTLYFGSNIAGGGEVTEAQFAEFLERVVTPRFPDGLTVWNARGQWRDASGRVLREPSHVLRLLHPDMPGAERGIAEIIAGYRAEFRQEAVLRVREETCVGF
jgi:Protein of unknown function (DUF3574)